MSDAISTEKEMRKAIEELRHANLDLRMRLNEAILLVRLLSTAPEHLSWANEVQSEIV